MIELRPNQTEPVRKAIEFFRESKPKPSLIVLPTAWGKSILTAFVAKNCTDKMIVLQPSFNVRVLSTGFDYTGIDCIVLGISTASIALYYQIIGRGTRIDKDKEDCLIIDLGGNVDRFGKVEDITFEKGRQWRMFGTDGRLLSGIPIHDIGNYTRKDTEIIDRQAAQPITIMPFGKYKGTPLSQIPTNYKQWMIRSFDWNSRNEKLRRSIVASM